MVLGADGRQMRRPPGYGRREYQPVAEPAADISTYACGLVCETQQEELEEAHVDAAPRGAGSSDAAAVGSAEGTRSQAAPAAHTTR